MDLIKNITQLFGLILLALALVTCSGGGGSKDDCRGSATNAGITTSELLDPMQCKNGNFGSSINVLPNGNVVVYDPGDSSIAFRNGAFHLFDPLTQVLIRSFFGNAEFSFENSFVMSLPNSNFVIVSPDAREKGVIASGAVRLIDGQTGIQIGDVLVGDLVNDRLGSGGVTVLTKNNFVIASPSSSVNGLEDNGSVMLIDGATGMQIGSTIAGDNFSDNLGNGGVVALTNGNFVVVSYSDFVAGITNAGSIKLFDGNTGVQIGNTIAGDNDDDRLGEPIFFQAKLVLSVKDLGNGNFVIASPNDTVAGINKAGSVMLVDGNTGLQIGSVFSGDDEEDQLGVLGATVLVNGNFVVASFQDDHNGIVDAGTVRLIDGITGTLIAGVISGGTGGDMLGSHLPLSLANGNFAVASPLYDDGANVNAGSVMLISGTTGLQIGSTVRGNHEEDQLGINLEKLKNNNFVVVSRVDGNETTYSGSVRLVDGETGVQLGNTIIGEPNDKLGNLRVGTFNGIASLPNGNFVVPSPRVDDFLGGVFLVDGLTGSQIGETIKGDIAFDQLGSDGVFALSNNNYVIVSGDDNVGGKEEAGSIRLVSGVTGLQLGEPIVGKNQADLSRAFVVDLENSDYFLLGGPFLNINNSSRLSATGFVGLVDKSP